MLSFVYTIKIEFEVDGNQRRDGGIGFTLTVSLPILRSLSKSIF